MLENTGERPQPSTAWIVTNFSSLHGLQLFDFPRTWDTLRAQGADVSSATCSSTMTGSWLMTSQDQTALRVLVHRWLWELLAQFCLGGKIEFVLQLSSYGSYLYLGEIMRMRMTRTCLKLSSETWCPAAKTFDGELPVGPLKAETLSGLKWQNLLP